MSLLAVVIHTFDKYEFLWEGWYYYFNKYWCYDLPFRVIFLNDIKEIAFNNGKIVSIQSGPGEWSNRLISGLNQIEEPYILYMQEDFWLNELVDYNKFMWLYNRVIENDFNKLLLTSISVDGLRNDRIKTPYEYNGNFIYKIKNTEPYLMSHQPTIWNKEFFKTCLIENESPWANEYSGSRRLRLIKDDLKFYHFIQDTPGILQTWYNAVYNSVHNAGQGAKNGCYNKLGIQMIEAMQIGK